MLNYIKHTPVPLKDTGFNEKWLHDRICDDPVILGLGDVRVLAREKSLAGGGRLDMILLDEDSVRRYEVEIQLGSTDPSHIIRTIEYWDLERRRYPAYEHVSVIIAENITTRFLNVMALLSGSIPLIAIQLDALKIGDQLVLNFTQVLDLTQLRDDDIGDDPPGGEQTDRNYWEKKAGSELMKICDGVLGMINQGQSDRKFALSYLRHHVGLQLNGVVDNFIAMYPKPTKKYCHLNFRNLYSKDWKKRCDEEGLTASGKHKDRLNVLISPDEFQQHLEFVDELVKQAVLAQQNE